MNIFKLLRRATAVTTLALVVASQMPAAMATDPIDGAEVLLAPVDEHIDGQQIDLTPVTKAMTAPEEAAVATYLEAEGNQLDSRDLDIAAIEVDDSLDLLVVVPKDEVVLGSVDVTVDPESNEVSTAANSTVVEDQLVTSGPGLGGFPDWADQTQYQIQLNSYLNGIYIGYGRFSTKFRNKTNDKGVRLYQYTRHAYGQPSGPYPVKGRPDYFVHVRKLWISNRLTAGTQDGAGQFQPQLTSPDATTGACASSAATIGPWGAAITDCSSTDVWQSGTNVGHMRVSMDQGQLTTKGSRAIAYVNGFSMRSGSPSNTYYEFVTFRVGGAFAGYSFKCTSESRGTKTTTEKASCSF